MARDIAIDLGTANTLVYIKGEGIVFNEPTVIAYNQDTREVYQMGRQALQMIGRTPSAIKAVRPLRRGAITDPEVTQKMIRMIFKSIGIRPRLSRPKVLICVSSAITGSEQMAVVASAHSAGAAEVRLIQQPVAAAMGCGLDIYQPEGNMVVDIGGGTSEAIIVSLGGTVSSSALRVGSFNLDESIQKYIHQKYNLAISDETAEKIKIEASSAIESQNGKMVKIRGLHTAYSRPNEIDLRTEELRVAIEPRIREIINSILDCIREAPPEVNQDIVRNGIYLVGGGSQLNGLGKRIAETVNVPVHMVSTPMECVISGAGTCIEHMEEHASLFV